MLQIGRSSESPIDFVVMDTIPGDKSGDNKVMQSTISRFACRILADRSNPKICRIYAAGFDTSRNIFLGVSTRYFAWSFAFYLPVVSRKKQQSGKKTGAKSTVWPRTASS